MVKKLRVVPDHGILIVGAIVLFCLIQSPADPVNAAVFECRGPDGSKILTDRPKGLHGCVIIETLAPSPSGAGAPQPGSAALDHEQDNSPPPVPAPQPMVPHLSPGGMSRDPMQAGSVSDQPGQSSGQESKPCPPGINPLNPLARGHCSSGASPSPDATHEPQQSAQ
ncbi:hypothetical protein [Nitrospira sp. Nam80]